MENPFSRLRVGLPLEEDMEDKPEEEPSEPVVVAEEEPSEPLEVDPTLKKVAKGFEGALTFAPFLAEKVLGIRKDILDLPKKVGITKHKYLTPEHGAINQDSKSGVLFLENDPTIGVIPETGRLYERLIAPKSFDPFDKKSWGKLAKPTLELEEVYEPTWIGEELSESPEWLANARTVYKAEEGKDYKKSDAELSRWFRNRHAKLANDMTNMGLTALDTRHMTAKTKDAFVNSMDMWDDTHATIGSFGLAAWQTITDPLTLASIIGTLGIGPFVKKYGPKKARELVLKFSMDDLTKKELTKRINKEVAQQWAEQGFHKEITTETLSQAQKAAARELGKNAAKAGAVSTGIWSGSYDAEFQWLNRELGRDGWEEYSPLQTAQAVLLGAGMGGPVGQQLGSRMALIGARRKLRNHQGRLDFL